MNIAISECRSKKIAIIKILLLLYSSSVATYEGLTYWLAIFIIS